MSHNLPRPPRVREKTGRRYNSQATAGRLVRALSCDFVDGALLSPIYDLRFTIYDAVYVYSLHRRQ
jgi:hypothetical protein